MHLSTSFPFLHSSHYVVLAKHFAAATLHTLPLFPLRIFDWFPKTCTCTYIITYLHVGADVVPPSRAMDGTAPKLNINAFSER